MCSCIFVLVHWYVCMHLFLLFTCGEWYCQCLPSFGLVCGVADGHDCLGTFVVPFAFVFVFYILSRVVSDDCRELATQFFDFVFCFGGFAVPSFDPYVFPLYDQHILRIYLHCTLYTKFFVHPLV